MPIVLFVSKVELAYFAAPGLCGQGFAVNTLMSISIFTTHFIHE